ncbi:MAG: hypothetical protein HYV09_05725 [Deltaproteobacteria bacterium]|nr:hypothetical protein [Deltaproteobacteria bacterium]
MIRRALVLAVSLVTPACVIHQHGTTNAPGRVKVEEPPKDLAVRAAEPPADPGEEVTVVSAVAAPLGVGWTPLGTREARAYMPFSLELAFSRHTLEKSHQGFVAPQVLDGTLRPNIGMTFLRVFPGHDKVDVGPTFVELQYVGIDKDPFWAGTLAAGVATTFRRVGPQATACIGSLLLFDLCVRGSYLFREGASVQLMFGYQGVGEWTSSR